MGSFSLLAAAVAEMCSFTFRAVERAGLRTLNEGQSIDYEIESNRGKDRALNVALIATYVRLNRISVQISTGFPRAMAARIAIALVKSGDPRRRSGHLPPASMRPVCR